MPKKRKLQAKHAAQASRSKPPTNPPHNPSSKPPAKKHKQQAQHERPILPFAPHERILLVGEGDVSFAASLVRHHRCTDVVATVFEKNEAELLEKYPHAKESLDAIAGPIPAGEDDEAGDVPWEEDYGSDWSDEDAGARKEKRENNSRVVYAVDASKAFPASVSRPPPERIIFNFPHTGGLSTDVNRQVRANQSLLVSFFENALKILSSRPPSKPPTQGDAVQAGPGSKPSIVVTLFEAEPYTLWNVRDLGRHCGLQVERSFKFQAGAYPGYHHARTCGVVKSRAGREGGGWKGEERGARSYVFVRKDEPQKVDGPRYLTGANADADAHEDDGTRKKRKRKGDEDSDSD